MIILFVTTVYLLTMCLEYSFRFGLFDQFGKYEDRRIDCDCEKPPCTRVHAWNDLIVALVVFYFDFYFTRGFSENVIIEKRKVDVTVETANIIASALAEYDLESAQEALDIKGEELPLELFVCYVSLLRNLQAYKPYLPRSCLLKDAERNPTCEAHANDKVIAMTRATTVHQSESEDETSVSKNGTDGNGTDSMVTNPLTRTCDLPTKSIKIEMKKSNVTFVVVNIHNTLSMIDDNFIEYTKLHRSYIISSLAAFDSHKGVTDLFLGDRLHVSFNASRLCYSHGTAAVSSVSRFKELIENTDETIFDFNFATRIKLSIGIAKGEVIHGDLGCDSMRRFSVVGKLPLISSVLERFSRQFGVECVCDAGVEADVGMTHELRLILQTIALPSKFSMRPLLLYEMVINRQHKTATVGAVEWMYQLEKGAGKRWEQYNEGGRLFIRGDSAAAEKRLEQPSNDGCEELYNQIREGLRPPPPFYYGFQNSDPESMDLIQVIDFVDTRD